MLDALTLSASRREAREPSPGRRVSWRERGSETRRTLAKARASLAGSARLLSIIDEDLIESPREKARFLCSRELAPPPSTFFRRRAIALCPGYSPALLQRGRRGPTGELSLSLPACHHPPTHPPSSRAPGVNGVLAVKGRPGVEAGGGEGVPSMLALDGSSAGWFGWLG